jgi:predicted transcriptional regulator
MSPEKQRVLEMIEALPDESTVDDILEELHFRLQVDKGLEELDSGKGIPHEQVRSTLSRWLER